MPDTERITLEVSAEEVARAKAEANRDLESIERQAGKTAQSVGRAFDQTGQATVRVIDNTSRSINRLVADAEKKAASVNRSTSQRLEAQRDATVKRLGGDPEAIDKVTAAYARLIEQERRVEQQSASLARSRRASQDNQAELSRIRQAAALRDQQAQSALRSAAAIRKEREEIEREIRTLERRAALTGKTGAARVGVERQFAVQDLTARGGTVQDIARATAAYRVMETAGTGAGNSIGASMIAMAGKLGIAVSAAGLLHKTLNAGVDATIYAAETETMGVAVEAVARANSLAIGPLREQEKRLKALGIGTQEARQGLLAMATAQLDTNKATELARFAQDAAVVGLTNSSEAFSRLIHGIRSGQVEVLRTIGINVLFERGYVEMGRTLKKSAVDLTEQERLQSRLNQVLREAPKFAGLYTAAMDTAGKQLGSLTRHANEARNAIGGQFQTELSLAVKLLTELAKAAQGAAPFVGALSKISLGVALGPVTTTLAQLSALRGLFRDDSQDKRLEQQRAAREKHADSVRNLIRQGHELDAKIADEKRKRDEKAEEDQKKRIQAIAGETKSATNDLRQAQIAELQGLDRINAQHNLKIQQLREEGVLTSKILQTRERERDTLLETEQKKLRAAASAGTAGLAGQGRRAFDIANLAEELRVRDELSRVDEAIRRASDEQQLSGLEARKQVELRSIEETTGNSLRARLAAAEQVFELEQKYAIDLLALRASILDREISLRAAAAQTTVERDAIIREGAVRGAILTSETQARIDSARQEASIRQIQIQRTENERLWESTQRSVEGVLDAMISRTRSLGDFLRQLILAPVLSLLKQIASTAITGALLGGTSAVAGSSARSGGLLGGLLGGVGLSGSLSRPGAPGGTGGFAGPVQSIGGLAGLRGFSGIGGGLSALGNLGRGAANATLIPQASAGVGGAAGGGMLLGGGVLAAMGLQRGGISGLAMTTAGGALIGGKFGGPIGAAIGAGIGAIAGTIRLFVKGAAEKVQQKVQQVYGIRIERNFAQDPLVGIIKQQFGGNIEVGIRSPQVRDLLELYAMSTGQPLRGGLAPSLSPSTFSQRGGVLTAAPVFYNGSNLSAPVTAPSGPTNVTVVLDPGETHSFWETQTLSVMGRNPGAVQSASLAANQRNIDRRRVTASQLNPGMVTA